jgi:hypothetical protein
MPATSVGTIYEFDFSPFAWSELAAVVAREPRPRLRVPLRFVDLPTLHSKAAQCSLRNDRLTIALSPDCEPDQTWVLFVLIMDALEAADSD